MLPGMTVQRGAQINNIIYTHRNIEEISSKACLGIHRHPPSAYDIHIAQTFHLPPGAISKIISLPLVHGKTSQSLSAMKASWLHLHQNSISQCRRMLNLSLILINIRVTFRMNI